MFPEAGGKVRFWTAVFKAKDPGLAEVNIMGFGMDLIGRLCRLAMVEEDIGCARICGYLVDNLILS